MAETHSGGCACGAVRYRVFSKPIFGVVCHCKFCQRRLASAFAVIASFDEKSVEIIQGKLVECEHRSDESGRWLKMSFCLICSPSEQSQKRIRLIRLPHTSEELTFSLTSQAFSGLTGSTVTAE